MTESRGIKHSAVEWFCWLREQLRRVAEGECVCGCGGVCVCVGVCVGRGIKGYEVMKCSSGGGVVCACVCSRGVQLHAWSHFILITTLTDKHDIEQWRILIYMGVCSLHLALTVTVKGTGRSELSEGPGDAMPCFNTCGPCGTRLLNSSVHNT